VAGHNRTGSDERGVVCHFGIQADNPEEAQLSLQGPLMLAVPGLDPDLVSVRAAANRATRSTPPGHASTACR
jgi:hypothetical protein